ncbi:MAG: carbohydrate ABC transporter permease [Eubacteriales bacterium]
MNNQNNIIVKAGKKILKSNFVIAYLFLLPAFLILFTFSIYPALQLVWLSLRDTLLIRPSDNFIGIANYSRMIFEDSRFWNAIGNTFVFVFLSVPLQTGLALLIALGLKRKVKGLAFLRAGYFAPVVVSMAAVSMVWQWMYHPNLGWFNYFISIFGLEPINWLRNSNSFMTPLWTTIKPWIESVGLNPANWEWINVSTSMLAVVFLAVWKGTGFYMVIYLAGLMDIPNELYEAADVDGANTWQKFKNITWPLLTPTTYMILILQAINSFQVFSSVYMMTGGGPSRKTEVIVYYIYNRAFQSLEMGYASAISLFLFVFLLIMTIIQKIFIGSRVHYDR